MATALAPLLWRSWTSSEWAFGRDLTFRLVSGLLRRFIPEIATDPSTYAIGTQRFAVSISGLCSGWEGLGLVMIATALILWRSRREYRFPFALALIPIAMLAVFALNVVRIAVLVLIGHYGAPGIAINGFHSQAGWIAFSSVAIAISFVGPRIPWFAAARPSTELLRVESVHNPSIPFLLPFAVILAAGMISQAAADGFEWLYPLRFFLAALVLFLYRRDYRRLECWRLSWFPLLAGGAVFIIWIALDRGTDTGERIAIGLATLPAPARLCWLGFRTLASITTVPLAEELAFRGFLFRRFISSEFESVEFTRFSYTALIASSVLFGFMHGNRWLAGTLAGGIYAFSMLRRGRIGDAVAAHAVTNGLLSAWVLTGNRWYLW
jgi:exosortase E/protease (VPEID-CTERM system)